MSKKRSSKENRPVCISLFSGCGGLDLGVEAAGFRVAVATDAEPTCAETYKKNFNDVPFVVGKIGQISTEQLLAAGNINVGEVDLLVGGPPCPAFSKSRFYRTEKPRALDDPVAADAVLSAGPSAAGRDEYTLSLHLYP